MELVKSVNTRHSAKGESKRNSFRLRKRSFRITAICFQLGCTTNCKEQLVSFTRRLKVGRYVMCSEYRRMEFISLPWKRSNGSVPASLCQQRKCIRWYVTPSTPLKLSNLKDTSFSVKFSLCFNWAPRHEGVLGEWRYSSTHSLTSVLDGGEWSASRPGRFIPKERVPGTHCIGGWVGPRAGLDAVVRRKISSPCRELNPRSSSP